MTQPKASAVVITRNRSDMLRDCLERICATNLFGEIILVDDASSDNTAEVAAHFADRLRYVRRPVAGGPSAARNTGASLCQSEFIYHFDDDSLLSDASFFYAASKAFLDGRVAAVAMPFRNVTYSDEVFRIAPDELQLWFGYSFTACAYAIRKSAFESAGGFREFYFYMGEESDLTMRLLDRGLYTAYVKCTPIDHMQPIDRSTYLADFYGRRNDVLSDFLNIPAPDHFYHASRAVIHGINFGMRNKKLGVSLKGLAAGLGDCWNLQRERSPVKRRTFEVFQTLRQNGPLTALSPDVTL